MIHNKYSFLLLICVLLALLVNSIKVPQGFTHIDEPDLVFDIFRFLNNLAGERELIDIVWPDRGMNGPLGVWIYSPVLVIFSYLLPLPVDMVLRGITLLCLPLTAWFMFRAASNMWNARAGFWACAVFLTAPYYTIHNHLAMGEVWYTLGLAISLAYLSKGFQRRDIYIAFFFFGIGLSYKYTYAPLAVIPVAWVVINWREIQPRVTDLVFGGVFLFIGVLPLLLGIALQGVEFLTRFNQLNDFVAADFGDLLTRVWEYLSYGLGGVILVTALAGAVRVFLPGEASQRKAGIVFFIGIAVPLIFLLGMKIVFFRYYYPLLIPAALLAAYGIDGIFLWASSRGGLFHKTAVSILVIATLGQAGWTVSREVLQSHGGPLSSNVIVQGESVWRLAANHALRHSNPDSVIGATNPASFYIFGKRPMALNIDFSSLRHDDEGKILTYKMSGLREFPLDEKVCFFLIPAETVQSGLIPAELKNDLELVWDGGVVHVYSYLLACEEKALQDISYRYDLKSIVSEYKRSGLQAPGVLVSE